VDQTGNGRLNLARALADTSTAEVQPAGAAPVGDGGPFVGPYVAASVSVIGEIAPAWAGSLGGQVVTFATLTRNNSSGGAPTTLSNVRVTLPVGYSSISIAGSAFSSGTWAAQPVDQVNRTVEFRLTSGSPIPPNGWARIDITATTAAAPSSADWQFRGNSVVDGSGTGNALGTDTRTVLIGSTPDNGQVAASFRDLITDAPTTPILRNGVSNTLRMRLTQVSGGSNKAKYLSTALPICFGSPTSVSIVSTGATFSISVIDNFLRMPSGGLDNGQSVTVTFNTVPNCTSGVLQFPVTAGTNANNPPQGSGQVMRTDPLTLPVAAGLADLSITKTDSPDPVASAGQITYTIGVTNAGPDPASAVRVVDTLPTGTTLVSASGTNWTCVPGVGTVTCDLTGNLAVGSAPNITIVVTAPVGPTSLTNSATVSSPNDATNSTATATTTVNAPNAAPVCANDSGTTNEDVQLADSVACSDADVSQTLTYSVVSTTTNGLLTFNPNGSFTYQPNANFNGADSFTFRANDGIANSNTATYSITVSAVNDAPVADDETISTNEDTSVSTLVSVLLAGDTDVDSATLTVTGVSNATGGTAVLHDAGTPADKTDDYVTFSPTANLCGVAAGGYDYTVSDGSLADTGRVTVDITCVNDAPVVSLAGSATADEGDTNSYTFSITDVDSVTFTVDSTVCGTNGTLSNYAFTSPNGSFDCTFSDDSAGSDVSVSVSDDDGGTDSDTITVVVSNVNPVVSLVGSATADEGDTNSYTYSWTDPGTPDTFPAAGNAVSCGSNGTASAVVFNPSTKTGSFDCTWSDDSGTGTVAVSAKVTDDDGGHHTATIAVDVDNVAPVIGTITGTVAPVALGGSASISAPFADAGTADTHTCTVLWGDATAAESGTVAQGSGSGTCTDSHVYTAAGVYTVRVTVSDDDWGSDTENYLTYVVIYDPNGGFVTGGGWINSPVGAYAPDPTLTGKANFGFVSKYQKGASVPTGNTEFQFHAGNLNFKSTAYEWLVISGGYKAQYKGTGTINGAGTYQFSLTVIDGNRAGGGGVDKFRMRIWGASGLVYDNQVGAGDTADPTTAISGGSIVVHTK